MFELFTDRARKVMSSAQHEAKQLNHEFIGTEHILLGILKESNCVAAKILQNLNVSFDKCRENIENIVTKNSPGEIPLKLPLTEKSKVAINAGMEEATRLGHNYFGTEHLLFGILSDKESLVSVVLQNQGVTTEMVVQEWNCLYDKNI